MSPDLLNDAMCNIYNYERVGKSECPVKPTSKTLIEVLKIFQKNGYIGDFELIENNRGGEIKINLTHKINKCGVIKPRFDVKNDEITKWEMRFLPAKDFGLLIMSTSKGIMTNKEAKSLGVGGCMLAYVY